MDLMTTDWFRTHWYTLTWPQQVNVKLYTRTPEFEVDQYAVFTKVTSLASLGDYPEWVPCATTTTSKVAGVDGSLYLDDAVVSGLDVLRVEDIGGNSRNVEDSPLGSGWFLAADTMEIVSAAVWYIPGTVDDVINPVLFASTAGLGSGTVAHGSPSVSLSSRYGQSTSGVPATSEFTIGMLTVTGSSLTVNNRGRASNVATIGTTVNHNLAVGDVVTVASIASSGFNGTWVVTSVPSSTTFTYDNTGSTVTYAAGSGTAQKRSSSWNTGSLLLALAPPVWEGAHAQHVWLEPQRTNFIANPSFETNTFNWRASTIGGAAATITSVTGGVDPLRPKCGRVAGTGPLALESNFFPKVNRWYSVSVNLAAASGTFKVGLVAYDSQCTTKTYFRCAPFTLSGGSATTGFQEIRVLVPVPDDVDQLQLRIESTGSEFWVDNVLVDPHESQYGYFDGSSTDGLPGDFMWHGGNTVYANRQFSLWYNNYLDTKSRLIGDLDATENVFKDGMLDEWVPTGANLVAHWEAVTPFTPSNWSGNAFYPISNVSGTPISVPTLTIELPT